MQAPREPDGHVGRDQFIVDRERQHHAQDRVRDGDGLWGEPRQQGRHGLADAPPRQLRERDVAELGEPIAIEVAAVMRQVCGRTVPRMDSNQSSATTANVGSRVGVLIGASFSIGKSSLI